MTPSEAVEETVASFDEDKIIILVCGAWGKFMNEIVLKDDKTLSLNRHEMLTVIWVSAYMKNLSKRGTIDDFKKILVTDVREAMG